MGNRRTILRFPAGTRELLFSGASEPDVGPTLLPPQWVPDSLTSTPSGAEIKKKWSYASTPPMFSRHKQNNFTILRLLTMAVTDVSLTGCVTEIYKNAFVATQV
jgi:hypothetical protein